MSRSHSARVPEPKPCGHRVATEPAIPASSRGAGPRRHGRGLPGLPDPTEPRRRPEDDPGRPARRHRGARPLPGRGRSQAPAPQHRPDLPRRRARRLRLFRDGVRRRREDATTGHTGLYSEGNAMTENERRERVRKFRQAVRERIAAGQIEVYFTVSDPDEGVPEREYLWATPITPTTARVETIPTFTDAFSRDDVIEHRDDEIVGVVQ